MNDMQRATSNQQQKGHEDSQSLMLAAGCLLPGREAPMVSDVASPTAAEATRDRAVVRTGEGLAAVFPSREARPSLLALLLT